MEEWSSFVRSLADRYGLEHHQHHQHPPDQDQEDMGRLRHGLSWLTPLYNHGDDKDHDSAATKIPSQDPLLPCILECRTGSTTEGYNDCQESAAAQPIASTFATVDNKILSHAVVSCPEQSTPSNTAADEDSSTTTNKPASPTSVLAADRTSSSTASSTAADVPFRLNATAAYNDVPSQSSDCKLLPVANCLLADAGFPPVNEPVSKEQLLETLVDLAREYNRREIFIQQLLDEAEKCRKQEEQSNLLLVRQDGELQLWKKKLASSEQRSQAALSAAVKAASKLRKDLQALETANSSLQHRCSQLEHHCRSRERDARKFQTKLLESIEREESQRSKDVECYRNLKQKIMRARQARGAGGLDWNFLARDLKPLELVSIYERQKAAMALELEALRSEVSTLCRDLQDKENRGCQHHSVIFDPSDGKEGVLKKTCAVLQLQSASQLPGAVETLLTVNDAVPSLEKFVEQVCDVVLIAGREFLPRPTENPGDVPRILKTWLDILSAVTRSRPALSLLDKGNS